MGVYLSTASTEKFSSDGVIGNVSYGASSMQGWRKSQEDSHNCCPDFDKETNTLLFAVYDGHGGAEVAEFASRHLPRVIRQNRLYKLNKLPEALVEAFLQFDASLIKDAAQKELSSIAQLDKVESADEDEAEILNEEAEMPIEKVLENYGGVQQLPEEVRNIFQKNMKFKKNTEQKYESPAIRAKCNGPQQKDPDGIKSNLDDKLSNGHLDENENGKCEKVESTTEDDEKLEKAETSEDGVSSSDDAVTADGGVVNGADNEATPVETTKPKQVSEDKDEKEESAEPSSSNIPNEDEDEEGDGDEEEDSEEAWSDTSSEDEDGGEGDEEEEACCQSGDKMVATFNEEKPGYDSGCTAVVALLRDRVLHVANAGDSRCVLCRGGKAVDMSVDHKPEDEPELSRIKRAGGVVSYDGRVNGGLNLSRALGDHIYKGNEKLELKEQMISALPDIQTMDLLDEDEFIVIACDGIWNSMTSQEVVDFVKERIDNGVTKMSTICEQLFDQCLAPDTSGDGTGCDNMTAVIVHLNNALRNVSADVAADNYVTMAKSVKRSVPDSAFEDSNENDVTTSSKRPKLMPPSSSSRDSSDVPESTDSSTG